MYVLNTIFLGPGTLEHSVTIDLVPFDQLPFDQLRLYQLPFDYSPIWPTLIKCIQLNAYSYSELVHFNLEVIWGMVMILIRWLDIVV